MPLLRGRDTQRESSVAWLLRIVATLITSSRDRWRRPIGLRAVEESSNGGATVKKNARFQNPPAARNDDVPPAIRFRSHTSINRASLSSRHYRLSSPRARALARVCTCARADASVCIHALVPLPPPSLPLSRARSAPGVEGGGSTCARLKSTTTTTPCLPRNLLTRRLLALSAQPFSPFNRRENFRACNPSSPEVGRRAGRQPWSSRIIVRRLSEIRC